MIVAIFFVLLVFAMFAFAFGAPIVSYFVTVKERWPDYPRRKRLATLTWTLVFVTVFVLLIIWATSPFKQS
jgi:hypothetical protein